MSEEIRYGAFARLEAMYAGHPEWWLVTRWPLEDGEEDE